MSNRIDDAGGRMRSLAELQDAIVFAMVGHIAAIREAKAQQIATYYPAPPGQALRVVRNVRADCSCGGAGLRYQMDLATCIITVQECECVTYTAVHYIPDSPPPQENGS